MERECKEEEEEEEAEEEEEEEDKKAQVRYDKMHIKKGNMNNNKI